MKNELKTRNKILNFILVFLLFIILNISFISKVFASQFYFESSTHQMRVGNNFTINLILDTQGQKINALEGKVIFPDNVLRLKEIRDGNSIVNFWAKPLVLTDIINNNTLEFAGIIPGGFNSETGKGLIFSFVFETTKVVSSSAIVIADARALLNDGKGTADNVSSTNFNFLVSSSAPPSAPVPAIKDEEPPEDFPIYLADDKIVYGGKWFAVFATQDKKSGINHYELAESKNGVGSEYEKLNWQTAVSPHLLQDQKLQSYIYVKAVDNKNNERISVLPPRNTVSYYENLWFRGIIILLLFFFGGILWRIRKYRTST